MTNQSSLSFRKFTMRDIVFLALISAVELLAAALIMPLVMYTQLFALRNFLGALFLAFFFRIALEKVQKLGALTICGILTGAILAPMAIIMLINQVFAALLAEVITFLVFRNYDKPIARDLSAYLYAPLTIPITLLSTWAIKGVSITQQLTRSSASIFLILGTFVTSAIGVFLAKIVIRELHKAGKL